MRLDLIFLKKVIPTVSLQYNAVLEPSEPASDMDAAQSSQTKQGAFGAGAAVQSKLCSRSYTIGLESACILIVYT
jgi:hypothetical protein